MTHLLWTRSNPNSYGQTPLLCSYTLQTLPYICICSQPHPSYTYLATISHTIALTSLDLYEKKLGEGVKSPVHPKARTAVRGINDTINQPILLRLNFFKQSSRGHLWILLRTLDVELQSKVICYPKGFLRPSLSIVQLWNRKLKIKSSALHFFMDSISQNCARSRIKRKRSFNFHRPRTQESSYRICGGWGG